MINLYHVTTTDRVERCLAEGLIPYKTSEASPEMLEFDRRIDYLRPEAIVQNSLSRCGSVYAHTRLGMAVNQHNGIWLENHKHHLAYLAITIDPREAYIADVYSGPPDSTRNFSFIAASYWSSALRYDKYLELSASGKEPTYHAPRHDIRSGVDKNHWQRYFYLWPEVLIPRTVAPNEVSLVPLKEIAEIKALQPWER